jgi:D-glycero-D-manno-heptose 1,7-bisphosphate phosphatase
MATPALFLDRDGVINEDSGYTHRIEDFVFIDGIFELCAAARAAGRRLFVVTNQAGIGRGYYDEATFLALTRWMEARFADAGVPLDRVYHCPCHPEEGMGAYRRESPMRKPNPGMLLQARDEFALDLPASVMVGDKWSDIEAGQRAGLRTTLLYAPAGVPSGRGPEPTAVIRSLRDGIAHVGTTAPP